MPEYTYILICYLIGAIPFGLIIGKTAKGIDIRNFGSCNLGATNAGRVLGKKLGIIVLILDTLKGLLPILFLRIFYHSLPGLGETLHPSTLLTSCAAAAILGHVFPVYLSFKGGKGVATGTGVLLALLPWVALCIILTFSLLVWLTKYVSLASVISALCAPLYTALLIDDPFHAGLPYMAFTSTIAVLLTVRHINNIQRLVRGTETKVNAPKENLDTIQFTENTHEQE